MPAVSLVAVAPQVFGWFPSPSGHGRTNAAVIVDENTDGSATGNAAGSITVVDTLMTPSQVDPFADAVEALGIPIRRVVYTSSHIDVVGGSPRFWMAARYGRSLTSALLDQPPNINAFRALHPEFAREFDELVDRPTRPVSHTVDTGAYLTDSHLVVPTQGHQAENLVVLVPGSDVLFAGSMATFGVTPNAFDGDPSAWADSLGELGNLASIIVPGIGPVGGADELLALQAYLYACVDADGDASAIPPGPWDAWADRHLDEINVERASMLARDDPSVPPSMLRLLGLAP